MERDRPLVLVTGSREWDDVRLLAKRLDRLPRPFTLMQGTARGADTIAAAFARFAGQEVVDVPAPWGCRGPQGRNPP